MLFAPVGLQEGSALLERALSSSEDGLIPWVGAGSFTGGW